MTPGRYLFKDVQYVYCTPTATGKVRLEYDGVLRLMSGTQFDQLVEYGQFVYAPED